MNNEIGWVSKLTHVELYLLHIPKFYFKKEYCLHLIASSISYQKFSSKSNELIRFCMILFFLKRMVMNSLIYRYLNTILDFIWDYGISIASSFKLFTLYQIEYHLQMYASLRRSYLAKTQTNHITYEFRKTGCSGLFFVYLVKVLNT